MVKIESFTFDVASHQEGQRLDKTLREAFPEWGRQAVGQVIDSAR